MNMDIETQQPTDTSSADKAALWATLDQEDAGLATPPVQEARQEPQQPAAEADPATTQVPAATTGTEAAAEPAAAVDPARAEMDELKALLAQAGTRLRNAEGQIGGLKSEVSRLLKVKSAPPPGPSKMDRLTAEYPEFGATVKDAIEERMAPLQERAEAPPSAPVVTQEDLNNLTVETHHKGWRNTIRTPGFAAWMKSATPELQMLAASPDPQHAIRLLDLHKEHLEAAKQPTQQRDTRTAAAASIPSGRGPSAPRIKPVEQMTKAELWAHQDQIDAQKARGA